MICYYYGAPTSITRAFCAHSTYSMFNYDPRERSWYREAVDATTPAGRGINTWSSLYLFSGGCSSCSILGLSAVRALTRLDGEVVGVMAIDYTLDGLAELLQQSAQRAATGMVLYIAERNNGLLVATSEGNSASFQSDGITRANATHCNVPEIRKVARTLKELDAIVAAKINGELFIDNHRYVLSTAFIQDGLEWDFVVIQAVSCLPGYFEDVEHVRCSECPFPSYSEVRLQSETSPAVLPSRQIIL